MLHRKLDAVANLVQRVGSQSRLERIANVTDDEGVISGCVEDIRDALMDYQVT
jgi:hypothetical protein